MTTIKFLPSFVPDYSKDFITQVLDHIERNFGVRLDHRKFYFDVSDVAHQKHNSVLKITSRSNDLTMQLSIPYDRLDIAEVLKDVVLVDNFVTGTDSLFSVLENLLEEARSQSNFKYPKLSFTKDDFHDARIIRSEVTSGVTISVDVVPVRGSYIFTGRTKFLFTTCTTKVRHQGNNEVLVLNNNADSIKNKVLCFNTDGSKSERFMFGRNLVSDTLVDLFEIDKIFPVSETEFLLIGNFQTHYTKTGSGGVISTLKSESLICDIRGYISSSPVVKPYAELVGKSPVFYSSVKSMFRYGLEGNKLFKFDRNGCLLQSLELDQSAEEIKLSVSGSLDDPTVCLYYRKNVDEFTFQFYDSRLKTISGRIGFKTTRRILGLDAVFYKDSCSERVLIRPTYVDLGEFQTYANLVSMTDDGIVILEKDLETAVPVYDLILDDMDIDGKRTVAISELFVFVLEGGSDSSLDKSFRNITNEKYEPNIVGLDDNGDIATSYISSDSFSAENPISVFTFSRTDILHTCGLTRNKRVITQLEDVCAFSARAAVGVASVVQGDVMAGFSDGEKDVVILIRSAGIGLKAAELASVTNVTCSDVVFLGD